MTRSGGDVDRLREIADVAASLDLPRVRDDALAVAARIAAEQFYVACVGQFKRGKSTLIDALLDDPVLPSGIVPITAVPTVVRYGAARTARVRMNGAGGADSLPSTTDHWQTITPQELPQFVSEEHNPGNALGVVAVEVFVTSPLLATGMCLVDTPGLGSAFESNSAATRAFVPQIDAALVVIGADPPISGDELDLIAEVAGHVTNLLFVLNKSDRVTAEERGVASAFARTVIERRLHRGIDQIYQVSATERLARSGLPRDWDAFVAALETLGKASGKRLVLEAGRRTVARLATRLLVATREERAVLLRPAEENDRHIHALASVAHDGERALLDLGALFGADQHRLSKRFADERAEFLRVSLPHARQLLSAELAQLGGRFGPSLRRAMMHTAQAVAHRTLDPWLRAEQQTADVAYREAMSRFVGLAASFLDRLAGSELPELESLRGALDSDAGLRTRSAFVFNEVTHVAEPASPLRFTADVVLGFVARGALESAAQEFLTWLLEMNSSRVQYDVDQRAGERRRSLEAEIRTLLREVESRAKRALARANDAHARGADAVEQELRRLQATENLLTAHQLDQHA